MKYTLRQLEKIGEYAALLLNISDIAVLLELDEDELREEIWQKHTEISKTYRRAKAEIILEIRQEEIALAKLGSPGAMDIIQKYIVDQKIQEHE
jgi:hypothetical protein